MGWRDVVGPSTGVDSLINGSVPVEARPVMEASSCPPNGVGEFVDVARSLFRLPIVENLLRGSKRRRIPVRDVERSCEVEGRD